MSKNAEVTAWICFGLGALILVTGVAIGLVLGFVAEAKGKGAGEKVKEVTKQVGELKEKAVKAAEPPATDEAVAKAAGATGEAAESLLKEVGSVIGSAPAKIRVL